MKMETIEDYVIEEKVPIEEIIEPKKGLLKWFSSIFTSKHKIGELNGRWAALFKLVLFMTVICIPTLFTWIIWVTSNVYAANYHIESTAQFEQRIEELEKTDISRASLSAKLDKLEEQLFSLETEIIPDLDKTNSTEHAKISATLDLILKELKK